MLLRCFVIRRRASGGEGFSQFRASCRSHGRFCSEVTSKISCSPTLHHAHVLTGGAWGRLLSYSRATDMLMP